MESPNEMSVSRIWVMAGDDSDLNTIGAGWTGDAYEHIYINMECPGFVQTSPGIAIGCSFTEMSTFNGDQKDATFSIHKDPNSGNWWVQLQDISLGYYRSSLFTLLSKTSDRVEFGGEVYNGRYNGRHTTTQMGNGHFPSEGGLGISSSLVMFK
ncbi:uncharacterized protein LOC113280044 [Papaver somniferum]|uniref:uncharacterized protein LOC113280044 n=1 Tax=Papaver somniferum TaxID=3469 RepID=UPI000E701C93|nr:uncharacterized protein LOC113280044 [Papaver somniferum]